MPPGVTLDQQALAQLRTMGLSPEASQKVLDLGIQMVQRSHSARQQAEEKRVEKWHTAIFNDPDVGGEKFAEARSLAGTVLERFGSPELTAHLQESKVGFNPAFFKFMVGIGRFLKQAVSEDSSFPIAPRASNAGNSEEAKLRKAYPTMFQGKKE